jgi:hypothetical protein
MQFDRTTISVRERSVLSIADISLHVIRDHIRPLLFTFGLLFVPLMLLNYLLVGWMADPQYGNEMMFRYSWNMLLLILIESQLATVFVTYYLGHALFGERIELRKMLVEVLRISPRIFWCHGVVRGIFAVWALYVILLLTGEGYFNGWIELLIVPGIVFYALILRAVRPFITELLTLEKNPFRAVDLETMTLHRRSSRLHSPVSAELFGRAVGNALWATLLGLAFFGSALTAWNMVARVDSSSFVLNMIAFPLAIWFAAGSVFVNRFLSYLDIRTRQEGWSVELKLKAEAMLLTNTKGAI